MHQGPVRHNAPGTRASYCTSGPCITLHQGHVLVYMAGYEGESGEGTFYDDSVGSFEHDLVYALNAGVRHTVNVALAQALQPIKHHLLGFAEQQSWVPHSSSQEELPFSQDSSSGSGANPHQADFEQLVQALNKEPGYSSSQLLHPGGESKGDSDASSSSNSPGRDSDSPPPKRKAKSRHSAVTSQPLKVLALEPEDITHPRYCSSSSSCLVSVEIGMS
ncbi:hypothetical protein NDU88_007475 [Pleurodeles waltl]|uniref:Uncharacterized protein n=1 Tax=Pleurodeles waltl TaxID=8319 RepID=A0AAV7MQB8_PLEWA|nr:hypothetical protein NDU88_007475 [Pleurodeles waltl]